MANEKRLIDANKLPVTTLTDGGYWTKDVVYKRDIDAAPTVDAVPVVHGRWFDYDNDPMWQECSACGYRIQYSYSKDCKYCPNCGAKMDGGNHDGK